MVITMAENPIKVDFEEEPRNAFGGVADAPDTGLIEEERPAWLGEPPLCREEDVKETLDCEVLILGAGVAGISAARAAAEAGADVLVLEMLKGISVRGMVFGCVDSRIHREAGCVIDKMELLNAIMRRMANRPNARLWKLWLDESGAAFDWFEAPLLASGRDFGQHLQYWPLPPAYDRSKELYPQFNAGIEFKNWYEAVKLQYLESTKHGAKYRFNTRAERLIREGDRVVGAYATDAEGRLLRVNASKGVILATGDYGRNAAMARALCPEFYNTLGLVAAKGSLGLGHKMAIWAGGMMEEGPHAHISHSFPSMVLGTTAALNLNANGDRYMNEDVPGQLFTNQIIRQPFKFGWQIFDSDWEKQLPVQNIAHGAVDVNSLDRSRIEGTLAAAREGKGWGVLSADTLEELVEKAELPRERALASIARYNALCEKGVDEDFGKRPDRLFPVVKPPFYAAKSMVARGMICGGVVVDEECRVLEKETWKPIGGLWAIGNVGGGRYYGDYPVSPVCATSHGTAITFGRHVGMKAARGE